ncbi:putative anthocyanidin reductase isoform X1 [Cryptomeria japonica]|uniref:putative anthocyanidin reductase isoform X1 n=1 Tax=Cryptomeria japonica TaxID=3369 RepID=UPI0027DA4747|nr:putative anthocyanidin reductase isoform X1 [Cryptomeria japonica]
MEGKFCVVGGDGFIGSSLVNSLLNRGFYVHATVLPTSGNEDIHYLQQLPGAHERLKLFNADLRVEGSFDSPISGCQGVYLVASPMDFGSKDPENEVVGVAIQGTINVLKSCVKAKTVKRVVFTSSSCAMSPLNEEGKMNNNPCSVESFWSPVNHFRSNKQQFPIWPYFVSKTLAEQTAWSFAAEHNLDVVTIGPSAVGGPFITPYISSSLHALLFFLPGNKEILNSVARSIFSAFGTFPVVHINDVCNAHIFLMEEPAAQGRYLCSADTLSVEELERFITKRYPDLKIINMSQDVDISFLINTHFESEKLKDLGFTFKHGIEDIYNDCIESYKKLGLLTSQ